jgi:hypothetical protein
MEVMRLFVGMRSFESGDGHLRCGEELRDVLKQKDVRWLLRVGVLCSETEIQNHREQWELAGSPTEAALVRLAIDAGMDVERLRERYPRETVEYRTEVRPFMRTVHRSPKSKGIVAVKGRPRDVLKLCRWHVKKGKRVKLSDAERAKILEVNDGMAHDALRVLGVVPIGPVDVLVSALGAVVLLLVNEGIKSLPAPRQAPGVGRADEGSDVKGLEDAAAEPAGSLLQPAKDDLLDPSMQRSDPQLATR